MSGYPTQLVDASAVSRNLQTLIRAMPALAHLFVRQVALAIKESAVPLAPILTGRLRASGRIETLPDGGVMIIFGGVTIDGIAVDYASEQHEVTWYHHPRGGQAKYLEQPLLQIGLGEMPHEIARQLLAELRTVL